MGGGTVTPTEPLYGLPGAEDTVEVSVDGDVLVTRRTGTFIADGDQYAPYASTFATPEGVYAYTAPLTGSGAAHKENFAGMCSHFTVIPRNAVQSERVAGTVMLGIPNSGDGPQAWFFTTQATAEAFNAWLQQQDSAGTPVTLVYELAAPGNGSADGCCAHRTAAGTAQHPRRRGRAHGHDLRLGLGGGKRYGRPSFRPFRSGQYAGGA